MNRNMNRVNRIHRNDRNTSTEMEQRHNNTKASKIQVVKNTGPIIFDIPEVEAQEIDGRIVVKMAGGGHIMDCSQIPQWVEANYRKFDAVCKEYLELAEPL
jgi:hypothetical protein